ncbi:queuine trna-ribosyltransferase-related protein, putative [Theileria annulata]|uniref:Queuine tRNA-ribosyltransferase-like protein n=1 Tax=Theileria annulata TaxID=5874 RepID=TGTL_THEAN|nr:queuine trna-ribosyltransferase-related protein, putative [Theileria annulata]Q4UBI4.1 RecName: Full=Queuine tRNA-ribosyltransferase-like protein [Theileria annulata]CAI75817.1 queuine trna-ribosyltransferase-related protein, putative [Theileria annulata]|eukprot:XP_955293.1 queuine trna-ribosyltransferase-related protein, putative [Theileria annulata]
MDNYDESRVFFREMCKNNGVDFPYRRGVIMSELHTPCCPVVCKLILPDPLTIDYISKIQQKPFLCIQFCSVLPCLPILEEFEHRSKNETLSRHFVDYEGAITLLTFDELFNKYSKIEDNHFVFHMDSNKYLLNEHTSKKIIDLINPSMAFIPTLSLKHSERKKWSTRKRTRFNDLYQSYYETLLKCSNKTKLVKPIHPCIEHKDMGDFEAIEFPGFGFGESLNERYELIKEMGANLIGKELRIIQLKTGTPLEILHAVLLGFDVVISPYPEILSLQGCALSFELPSEIEDNCEPEYVLNLLNEKCKFIDGVYKDQINDIVDLKNSVYISDVETPMDEKSIMKESRAYVNHLLNCKEMDGNIILSAHNLYMYEMLFQRIRDSIENNTLVSFVHNFVKCNLKED